jgi:hypothetical protein
VCPERPSSTRAVTAVEPVSEWSDRLERRRGSVARNLGRGSSGCGNRTSNPEDTEFLSTCRVSVRLPQVGPFIGRRIMGAAALLKRSARARCSRLLKHCTRSDHALSRLADTASAKDPQTEFDRRRNRAHTSIGHEPRTCYWLSNAKVSRTTVVTRGKGVLSAH